MPTWQAASASSSFFYMTALLLGPPCAPVYWQALLFPWVQTEPLCYWKTACEMPRSHLAELGRHEHFFVSCVWHVTKITMFQILKSCGESAHISLLRCHSKVPQTKWLKQQIFMILILEALSQKTRWQQNLSFYAWEGECVQSLAQVLMVLWQSLAVFGL